MNGPRIIVGLGDGRPAVIKNMPVNALEVPTGVQECFVMSRRE